MIEDDKKRYQYNYEIVGTSEWDVDAFIFMQQFIMLILKKIKTISEDKMNEYFSKFHHSFSGKELIDIKRIIQMEYERKLKYYKAHKISKNTGSIAAIDGKQLHETIGDIWFDYLFFPLPKIYLLQVYFMVLIKEWEKAKELVLVYFKK